MKESAGAPRKLPVSGILFRPSLVQDLNALAKADNPLLAELAIELLQQASQLEQRLKRLETLTR